MPFELLARLSLQPLPIVVGGQDDIDKLAVLKAADMVEAELPKMRRVDGVYQYDGEAVVSRITPLGQAAMGRRGG